MHPVRTFLHSILSWKSWPFALRVQSLLAVLLAWCAMWSFSMFSLLKQDNPEYVMWLVGFTAVVLTIGLMRAQWSSSHKTKKQTVHLQDVIIHRRNFDAGAAQSDSNQNHF